MSEEILGRVSAFADGECSDVESRAAVASLENPEMRETWHRYQLIGDAMRGDLPQFVDAGFAARVRDAIAQEPAILAPASAGRRQPAWLRPAAGVAIAATVAAVAVIGVGQRPAGELPVGVQTAANVTPARPSDASAVGVIATPPAFIGASPAAVAVGTPDMGEARIATGADGWIPVDAAVGMLPPAHSRLNSYIMHYSEQRTMLGSPGVLPYAKVVGYSPDR
jgi:sigma-E factor negative regulatory protein RseA